MAQVLDKDICQLPRRARRAGCVSVTEPCCPGGGGRELWHVGPSWLLDKSWAQLALCSGMASEFAAAELGGGCFVELRVMAN